MLNRRRIRLISTVAVLSIAAILLFWSLLPARREIRVLPLTVPQLGGPTPFGSLEARQIRIEWPATIRLGETGLVRLELEPVKSATDASSAQPPLDADKSYHLIAEARLEMLGAEVQPSAEISEPLLPGQSVTFFWHVRPGRVNDYDGTLWLYLRSIPAGEGQELRQAVSAQQISIQAMTFFGLAATPTKLLGALGLIIGVVLGFPFLGEVLRRARHTRRV
jgi:hypothetical protein